MHQISVEGGSTITLEISAQAETPEPIITTNYAEGAPGSVFILEGSGFTAEQEIQIVATGMTDAVAVQSNASGSFTLLLTTDNLASGLYELSIQPTTQGAQIAEDRTITIGLNEDHPRRARPTTTDSDIQVLTISGESSTTNGPKIFLPFLQGMQVAAQ